MNQSKVIIYTDGACKGNPGIGGYGAILKYQDKIKKISGTEANTTNNRMELTAVIEALKSLKRPCHIDIFTDSQYVQKGITQWIINWKVKNWAKVKNVDLWQALDHEASKHQINWHWVRGHNGDLMNEQADALANLAIAQFMA
ncbi:MAG: ribonuclease HI [Burkholderiales bacterium]|nr:ribonuclease HI [Burkholderiales bacterium]